MKQINFNKLITKKSGGAFLLALLLFFTYQLILNRSEVLEKDKLLNSNVNIETEIPSEENIEVGFTGLKEMNVCKGNSDLCYSRQVEFENGEVIRIYLPDGKFLEIDYSDCEDKYCYAEEEDGTEWDLVE
jgi:hypothetical protein